MRILFIADPLTSFKIYKETTYVMMQQAQQRGHQVYSCLVADISWQSTGKVQANSLQINLIQRDKIEVNSPWYNIVAQELIALADFDAVIMRKDPPFDSEYFYITHLLKQAQLEGAKVFNKAQSLYEHPEKLSLLEFSQFAPPTLVTKDAQLIRQFHEQYQDIILKPLDGMGGAGIFRVGKDKLNFGAIIESLNRFGKQTIMVQQFIPQISEGDKRVLIIGGQVVPFALARIPQNGEVRGNLASGGKGVAMPLTSQEQQVAQAVAPILLERGLYLVGLDMIGGKLTEINVTSPTGFQEITQQTGFDVAKLFIETIENSV